MQKVCTSSATKIKNDAAATELLIASYVVDSEFEEIFTSIELYDALNFTSLHKKF